jgi:hypothetical protein
MDALDQCVLGDDEAVDLGGVVLDPVHEPSTLELAEQAELTPVTDGHQRDGSVRTVLRLPPALAASATPRILELLGNAPGRVLELGFGGIHAELLRLAGFDVVVVEPDAAQRRAATERAGTVLAALPQERFDAVVAPAGADLGGVDAERIVLVARDGSVTLLD